MRVVDTKERQHRSVATLKREPRFQNAYHGVFPRGGKLPDFVQDYIIGEDCKKSILGVSFSIPVGKGRYRVRTRNSILKKRKSRFCVSEDFVQD